ncbi:GMC family oxidoreductase [uncultured Mucilaginibacter sp.]|uniref:GMC family oxidoreductase n=1 Tax=uncultured Mucilaginibacter sp. TaxID=797541 RepID=UPI00261F2382|nr:GMC family oxidoreductase [uncultured Mucilaginibacter sp.]
MRCYPTNETVDAVIIGTGAGGAPLMARLAKAGLKVVALEAGNYWNPAADFSTDEIDQNKLFWPHERLSAGKDPLAFGRNNSGIGVGGSTLHYTAYTPRPQPDDFNLKTDFGLGEDWPLQYEDLEAYYDELEHNLGISGPAVYPWGPTRKTSYPLPPLALNTAAQLMERGCKPLHIKTSPAANAALSATYFQEHIGWRNACTNRGFCQAGCTTGAKASMDVTLVLVAIHVGAEVRPNAFVTEIIKNKSGKIEAVVYRKDGKEEKQLCKNVFLCAGAVETPRLLLINGLANSSGQVGKNFMAHTGLQVWGEFDELLNPWIGIPGGLISEDMHRPADADFAGGYLIQSIGVMPVTYASQLVRATGIWGEELRERMKAYKNVAGINMQGDCLPYEHNYLELSDEPDDIGLPKPRIHFTNGENETRMMAHAKKVMEDIWKNAGANHLWTMDRNAHTIGTCRMGNDPERNVVDKNGQSFDIPNLYIADNSIFPSALSANPSLTIMALAYRIADAFLKGLG